MPKNYGLQFDKIESDHYYLGGGFIGTKEIQPDGQWDAFLPEKERQNEFVETMNCTVYGTLNCLEILFNKMFFEAENFSERFTGVLAETTETGNSPHKVAETIRKNGLIDDYELPFNNMVDTWDKYYSPKPMTRHYLNIGKKFLEQYEVKHEWVFTGGSITEKNQLIKEALKRGPVGISVYAWVQDESGKYYQAGKDNHWTCCYGYNDDGWKIFDSYDNTFKLYSFDADIAMAKLYWISRTNQANKKGLWITLFGKVFNKFII